MRINNVGQFQQFYNQVSDVIKEKIDEDGSLSNEQRVRFFFNKKRIIKPILDWSQGFGRFTNYIDEPPPLSTTTIMKLHIHRF